MTRTRSILGWLGGTGRRTALAGALLAAVCTSNASAGPEGWQVINGTAVFHHNGTVYIIEASHNAIIDYSAFNIESWETVEFIQPGAWARVLNRITGPDPSSINGTLISNGIVYFVNPAGVIFGNGSVIDVGGIYAAAGSISNADFLDNIDRFTNLEGSVVNHGTLTGESIHLLGQYVANHGSIHAPEGVVTMLAGNEVLMQEQGDTMYVKIDGNVLTGQDAPYGGGGAPSLTATPGVRNTGTINARKGTVVLGAGDLYSLAIENTGFIHAESGNVTLAAASGAVYNAGTIDVSSSDGPGGTITVQGPSVVNGGALLADSEFGQAGSIEVTSQNHTYLLGGSRVSAAGTGSGADGGDILIHSYGGLTVFADGAVVDVSGGAGGAGGFVEVSGRNLYFRGHAELRGENSASDGTLLIDPLDIHIVDPDDPNAAAGNALFLGQNGEILFGDPDTFTILSIGADVIETFIGTIILQAYRDFFVDWAINLQNGNDITFEAGRHMFINAPIIGAAALTLRANMDFGDPYTGGMLHIGDAGNVIDLAATGPMILGGAGIEVSGNLTANGIDFQLDDAGLVTFSGAAAQQVNAGTGGLTANGGFTKATDDLTLLADQTIDVADVEATAGSLLLQSALGDVVAGNLQAGANIDAIADVGGLTLGNVTASGGSIALSALGGTTTSGSLTAGGDVLVNALGATVNGDVEAGALANAAAGTGDVIFNAPATVSGNVTGGRDVIFNNTADIGGSVTAVQRDALFAAAAEVGGNIVAGRDVTFQSTATLDGAGDQLVIATSGTLSGADVIAKTNAGSLGLAAGTAIDLESHATSVGSLTFTGPTFIAGDVSADQDITFEGVTTFDGGVNQAATATNGTLWGQQLVRKANTGDLALTGGTKVDLDGEVISVGSLTFEGLTELQGDVTAAQDVNFGSAVTFDGANQSVEATAGTIWSDTDAPLTKTTTGNLDLTAGAGIDLDATGTGADVQDGDLLVHSTIDAEGDLSASGDAIFDQHADLAGNVTAGQDLQFLASVSFDGTTSQSAEATAGTLYAAGLVEKTGTGSLSLTGGTKIDLDDDVTSVESLTFNGDSEILGNVTAQDNVAFNGSATFDGANDQLVTAVAGTLSATGDVAKTNAGSLFLTGGTKIDLDSNVTSVQSLTFEGLTELQGNVTAAMDVNFGSAVTFDGGHQSVEATAGAIWADADAPLTKTTGGNLDLTGGAGIDLDAATSSVDVQGGSLLVHSVIDAEGDVTASQDAIFDQDADIAGQVAGGENVQFLANATVDGNVTAGTSGTGSALFTGAATLGGDVVAQDDVTFLDTGRFVGGTPQRVQATLGTLRADGTLRKTSNGDLVLNAGTLVDLNDAGTSVKVDGGNLLVESTLDAAGDVIVSGNATFQGQSTVGNDVLAGGNVTFEADDAWVGHDVQAGGDATFQNNSHVGNIVQAVNVSFLDNADVDNAVFAFGDASFGNGAAIGDIGMATGRVEAFGNVTFGNDATVGTHVYSYFGGASFGDDATIGDSVEALNDVAFGHRANVTNHVASFSGSASFADDATVGDWVTAGKDATFGDRATVGMMVYAGDNASFGNDATVGDWVQAESGDATFGHDATVGDYVEAWGHATFGDRGTVGTYVTTKTGDVLFGHDGTVGTYVRAARDAGFGERANVGSFVTASTGDAFFGDDATVGGNVTAAMDVEFAGTALLGGNVTGGENVSFGDTVTLNRNGTQRISAEGGTLTFGNDVHKVTGGALELFADEYMDISGDEITAVGSIEFETTDPVSGVPELSTVFGRGDLTIESLTGRITFGELEKLSVDGDMKLLSTDRIIVGDLASSGSIYVDAPTIQIRLREAGNVIVSPDTAAVVFSTEPDDGVDIVARTGITFTSAPGTIGVGLPAPQFANGTADNISFNTLSGYIIRVRGDDPKLYNLAGPNGRLLDLRATGQTITDVSDALAGAAPRETERDDVGQGVSVGRADLETLRRLGINARLLNPAEELTRVGGFGVYDDFKQLRDPLDVRQDDRRVALPRMEPGRVIDAVRLYDERMPEDVLQDAFRKPLGDAWLQFVNEVEQDADPVANGRAFRAYVESSDGLVEAAEAIRTTDRVLMSVQVLGLTRPEMTFSRQTILEQVWPSDVIPYESFEAMFVAPAAIE